MNMTTNNSQRDYNFILIVLALITLLAAVLRFYQLESESFWTDEAITAILVEKDFDVLVDELAQTGRPPVMIIMAHWWTQIFGHTDLAARALLAVLGVLCVPIIYIVGTKLFDQRVGVISAFLLAIGYIHIFYSQEYRYYGVLSFFTLAAAYFYIQALETKKWRDFLLLAVFSILMVYTHFLSAFVLMAWGLHFLSQWRRYQSHFARWIVSQILVLMLILPIFYIQYQHLTEEADEAETAIIESATAVPSFYTPVQTIFRFLFGQGTFTDWQSRVLILLIGAAAIGIFAFINRKSWVSAVRQVPQQIGAILKDQTSPLIFVFLWLVIPVLLLFVISVVFTPIYFERYVIGAAPGLYILLAVVLSAIRRVVPLLISLAIITAFAVPSLQEYYSEVKNPQWKNAAAYIADHIEPGDGLYVPVYGMSFYWYYRPNMDYCYIDASPEEPYPNAIFPGWNPPTDVELYNQCDRLWVVLRNPIPGRDVGSERVAEFFQVIVQEGYTQTEEIPLSKITISLFEK